MTTTIHFWENCERQRASENEECPLEDLMVYLTAAREKVEDNEPSG